MIYVKRNAAGEVIALSRECLPEDRRTSEGWTAARGDDADVIAFTSALTQSANPLSASDLGLVRVLEDLMDLLVARAVIRFTDLPPAAQAKLMERRDTRCAMRNLRLLDDESGEII